MSSSAHITAGLPCDDAIMPEAAATAAWVTAGLPSVGYAYGYHIYRGIGKPSAIDETTVIGAALPGDSSKVLSEVAWTEDLDYYVAAKAVSEAGIESALSRPIRVRIESGALASNRPAAVLQAGIRQAAGGKIELEFLYDSSTETASATKIQIGRVVGGAVNWGSPLQEIAISGTTHWSGELTDGYTHGQGLKLAVRAATAGNVGGPITLLSWLMADAEGPATPAHATAAQETGT